MPTRGSKQGNAPMRLRSHMPITPVARGIAAVCAAVFVARAHTVRAGTNVWTSHRPEGRNVAARALDPTTRTGAYANTYAVEGTPPGPSIAVCLCNTPGVCETSVGAMCINLTCFYPPAVGQSCNDGNACTTNDQCNKQRQCVGTPKSCTNPGTCETTIGATCSKGTCTYPAAVGQACDDGDPNTTNDTCTDSKQCVGTPIPTPTTPALTPLSTLTPTPTVAASPTSTATQTSTTTGTPTTTPSNSPSATAIPSTQIPTLTATPTNTFMTIATSTQTQTATVTPTPTLTSNPTAPPTATNTTTTTSTPTIAATQTATPTDTPTATATNGQTPTPTETASSSPTTRPTATTTLTPTPTPKPCLGDCNRDKQVTVNELIQMVDIALAPGGMSSCSAGDADGDGMITINEIIAGVNDALNGCPSVQ
jgi:hypothetical protein